MKRQVEPIALAAFLVVWIALAICLTKELGTVQPNVLKILQNK